MSFLGVWLTDHATGRLITGLQAPAPVGTCLISQAVVTNGEWHHVGLARDGANGILYVDDRVVAADTQSNLVGSTGGLNLGCDKNKASGSFWSGLIDDVRIYNRAVKP